ncbi:hypothetical protein OBBRIDRAFT_805793 [Obba rivulosa]|uniref:Histone H4 n=1 Tax=Obba rivulosa TaxID=1052685 RepID=A0A8E2ATE0_9APHY|nr:hypothetical protein OBBRIDRAFT_805793 [Obba rivulosa]
MSGRGKGGKGLGKGGAKRHRKILRDNIQGITKPAIRRLARRGGVKRISGLIYEETRGVLKIFLENVIRDSVTYTEHAKRKTVTALDVVYALKRSGRTLYGFAAGGGSLGNHHPPIPRDFSASSLAATPFAPPPDRQRSIARHSCIVRSASAIFCTFAAMASALPNETLSAIFDELQPSVLVHILCVSQRFRAVAERILYSNIVLLDTLPHSSPVPWRTRCCCDTIVHNPHLAEAVKKLSVRWQTESGPREPYLPFVESALGTLNSALRTLPQLEALELALGLAGVSISPRGILDGCAFPALRLFALSGIGRGAAPPKHNPAAPAPRLEWFLARTPGLQHLRLADVYEPLALAPGDLPQLATFRGSAVAAASVLPGRPVRVLALVGHEFVTERDLARIALSSARIRWLDLSAMSVTPLLLRDISRHLPLVEFLRVKLALRHTLHWTMSGISLLAGLTPVLGAFSELHQLDLSPTSVDGIGPGNALEESSLCTTWARGCPSLRQVIFPSKTEWTLSREQIWLPHPTPPFTRN